jgi:hypothetical protein
MFGGAILHLTCLILLWQHMSNDNFAHSLSLNVFMHGKNMVFEFFCNAHAWAFICQAFDLPKIVVHALM